MSISITHKFVSGVANSNNATVVRPVNWNDNHAITAVSQSLLGNNSTSAGAVSDLTISQALALLYGYQSATVLTVSTAAYSPGSSEVVILYNRTSNLAQSTLNLSSAVARNGAPILIKDIAGNAALDFINIVANGTELVDGLATISIKSNYGGYVLVPLSTSATGGYYVSP